MNTLDKFRRWATRAAEAFSYKVRVGEGGFAIPTYVYFSDEPRCEVKVGTGSYSGIIALVSNQGQKLTIGKYTSIGQRVSIIMAGGHNPKLISTYPFRERMLGEHPSQSFSMGDVSIGNDCWIGDDVTLLGGCTVCDGAVVGAKSLVTAGQVLDNYGVYGGVPAKLLYYRFDYITREKLKKLAWWDMKKEDIMWKLKAFYEPDIGKAIKELEERK